MSVHRFKSSQNFKKFTHMEHKSGVNANGGAWESRSARYKPVIADVELLVDTEALMRRLGARALASKSGRSAALHGLIKVKIVGERDAG